MEQLRIVNCSSGNDKPRLTALRWLKYEVGVSHAVMAVMTNDPVFLNSPFSHGYSCGTANLYSCFDERPKLSLVSLNS